MDMCQHFRSLQLPFPVSLPFSAALALSLAFALMLLLAFPAGIYALNQRTASQPEGLPPPNPPVPFPIPTGESIYQTMKVVGLSGDWDLNSATGFMKNPVGTAWEVILHLPAGRHEFRFVANRSWSVYWGAPLVGAPAGTAGTAILMGRNLLIEVPITRQYRIRFDDRSAKYSFDQAGGSLPPSANAGADMVVGPGTNVQFNGLASYDPDGTIASYTWSNGLIGPTPNMVYNEPGIFDVELTVTDNDGNTSQDSVRVSVEAEVALIGDLRRETLYYVLAPRFFNGDTTNDFYCRERVIRDDPHWRGDFAGLMQRLDYIKELGFTALCLSPHVENRGALDYAGNNPYDWITADPRLETPLARYVDLIIAAHQRGLKVIQSMIVNHTSNYGIRGQVWIDRLPHKFYRATGMQVPWPYIFNLGNYKHHFREDNDNPRTPEWFQDQLYRDPWGKGPLLDPKTGTVLPLDDYRPDRFFDTDEQSLDIEWYHRNGWLAAADSSNTVALQGKHLDGDSLDLATENWRVKRYINAAVRHWIDLGIDGVWIEYAGNTDRNELLTMVNDWKEKKPQLYVIADVGALGSGFGLLAKDAFPSELAPWWYSRTGTDPNDPDSGIYSGLAVVDTALMRAFPETIASGNFGGLENTFKADWAYGDPTTLVTCFHSPREGPVADPVMKFGGETWKAAVAYNLLWTTRGTPCIQQGEEIEFMKGAPLFPTVAGLMLDRTAHAYFGTNLDFNALPTTKAHPLFQHLKRLNLIRSRVPALQMGGLFNGREWTSGMSFVRDYRNGESYAVVGLAAFVDQEITVDHVRNGIYADAVTGQTQVVATAGTTLSFSVKGNSAGIWILNGPGKLGQDGAYLR